MTAPSRPAIVPEIGPDTRAENLERLERETFDVCVVGGGITGAGIALDAVSRGLSVALVERDDLGAGTSSKSSKMVHGGLRYLAEYQLGVFYESIRERNLLHRLAPQLVRPLRFLAPAFRKDFYSRMIPVGLSAYDVVSGRRGLGRHHRVDDKTVRDLVPLLNPDRLVSAWAYWDAQTDDTRLVFEVARTAHRRGAAIVTHAAAAGFDKAGERVAAALVDDRAGGRQIAVRARVFVNASGVWAGQVAGLDEEVSAPRVRPAKGIHLLVPSSLLPLRGACVIPSFARDGRSLFVVPWYGATMIGTTDTDYSGSFDAPFVDADDVAYVLRSVSRGFELDLGPQDVIAGFAGLRPLLDQGDERTADISRRHAIVRSSAGLITITGGKLTTYRRMAEDAMDLACRDLDVRARSLTRGIPIGHVGSAQDTLARALELAGELGLDPALATRLSGTHGDRAPALLATINDDRSLGEEVVPGVPVLRAEVAWAFRSEMALSLEDALARRTRLAVLDRDGGLGDAARIHALSGMDAPTFERDSAVYLERLRAERGALVTSQGEAVAGESARP